MGVPERHSSVLKEEAPVRAAVGGVVGLAMVLSTLYLPGTAGDVRSPPDPAWDEPVTFTNVAHQILPEDAQGRVPNGNFIAFGDYDRDDDLDFLLGTRLFRNSGPPAWDFAEVTATAFLDTRRGGQGVWGDYDHDGFLDIYVPASPTVTIDHSTCTITVGDNNWDTLWHNNGNGTFSNVTVAAGSVYDLVPSGVAGWGDMNRDGYLDLYVAGTETFFQCQSNGQYYAYYYPDYFYLNNGDGTFTDATVSAGIWAVEGASPKYGRGVTWTDYNDDSWQDLYVSNYRQQDNYLWENQGDGTFVDAGPSTGTANGPQDPANNPDPCNRGGHSVGASWGDYDNDGHLDLWVTNLNHKDWRTSDDSLLYRNGGPSSGYTFTNVRGAAGIPIKPRVAPPCNFYSGGGAQGDELMVGDAWGDYDNDGDLDLWLPQIYNVSYSWSYLYRQDGLAGGTFTDRAGALSMQVWDTYAGVFVDYDQDGDLDLFTAGRGSAGAWYGELRVFRNSGNSNAWLQVRLEGCDCDRFGTGARVYVNQTSPPSLSLMREIRAGEGPHGHENGFTAHFGLGPYFGTVDVAVRWPDGRNWTFLYGVAVDRLLKVNEPCGTSGPPQNVSGTLWGAANADVRITWALPLEDSVVYDYEVRRGAAYDPTGAGYQSIAKVPRGTTSFVDVGKGDGNPNTYFYEVRANHYGGASPSVTQAAKFTEPVAPGMRLLSVPLELEDWSLASVLQTLSYGAAWTYTAGDADPWTSSSVYKSTSDLGSLDATRAVWVDVLSTGYFTVAGQVRQATAIALRPGWNLVGYPSFSGTYAVADLVADTGAVAVEGFDAAAGPYSLKRLGPTDALAAGRGYWVRVPAATTWVVAS